ncbi:TetR/AcrR family transcriptional regulator [Brevibacterium sp. BDJS002]|uniref:TetR/AcrR family transcriptional regulator n=1 Tax=Brevibacterium sp. BDJS002 TaxID=3020906 RepID=UPI0023080E47|nr:TetR/AcrR family transcriptional regulator [Brevibacterium sp. BDJS002]WCE41200.1 TetR/AcrR family transcriptional regulator [Brevibacterium sp. BDJS002]
MNEKKSVREKKLGRPRAPGVEERVFAATLILLGRQGYDGTTMAAIADEAGITKPTLYRRWSNKDDLVTSAVSSIAATGPASTFDDVWDNLIAELEMFDAAISRPEGIGLLGNALALEQREPHLIEQYRQKVVLVRRARLLAVLEEARKNGEMDLEIDPDDVVRLLIGYYYAARVAGGEIGTQWPRDCVNLVRRGVGARGECTREPSSRRESSARRADSTI